MRLNLKATLLLLILFLASIPPVASSFDETFWIAFLARLIIYAIAASALNIALGLGGLVSLGHALFIGVGMYSVAIPGFLGISDGWIHLLICILSCSLIGYVTGLVSLRTSGIAFIMITLAFAQMGYFVVISLKQFGGDDGLAINFASDFSGFKLSSATNVYYSALLILAGLTIWVQKLRESPFGMILRGGRQNPRRVNSIGFPLKQYQLTAYIISAVFCGIAGMLLANLTSYASPSSMSWLVSGDLIVMVVLGGIGTIMGPIVGAFFFLGLEEILKMITDSSMMYLGLLIFLVAMLGKFGIVGWLSDIKKGSA